MMDPKLTRVMEGGVWLKRSPRCIFNMKSFPFFTCRKKAMLAFKCLQSFPPHSQCHTTALSRIEMTCTFTQWLNFRTVGPSYVGSAAATVAHVHDRRDFFPRLYLKLIAQKTTEWLHREANI